MNETTALLVAHGFGWFFNWLVPYCQARPRLRLPMGAWVALGCTVLLVIAAAVADASSLRMALYWRDDMIPLSNHQHGVLYVLKFLAAGGLPMVLGSVWRDLKGLGAY
jgi:hypothetical protein